MFLHFGINTFTDREWGTGAEDPALFNPAALDAEQWARTARAAGFRAMILTAKHHDGFCLWPSAVTDHSVKSSPWRDGRGDVVREFVDACRAEGLGAGLYLSPWDRHESSYGDSPKYNDFYITQLTELLTHYGPITEVWFDGANGEGPNGKRQTYDWDRIHQTVRRLQPHAVMFSDAGPDVRWIGNEHGMAGDPNWATVDPAVVPYPGASGDSVTNMLQHGDAMGSVWRSGEADVSIRPGWFWHSAEDDRLKSADALEELYFLSVGRNANLLLNVPPTQDGLLRDTDVRRLREFQSGLDATFVHDFANGAQVSASSEMRGHAANAVTDADPNRWWSPRTEDQQAALTLDFGKPVQIRTVELQEAIQNGQRVSGYRAEALVNGTWQTIAEGTTIGHRKLDRVNAEAAATSVRVTILSAYDTPELTAVRVW